MPPRPTSDPVRGGKADLRDAAPGGSGPREAPGPDGEAHPG
ncbi:hypothetical protein ABZ554_14635 [Streptomyces sp. NPDC020125]